MKKEEVERIVDRAKYDLWALLCAEPTTAPAAADQALPDWMTEEELMRYWRLDSVSGIQSWRKRPADQFPLPHGRLGDLVRYNRKDCDQWSREEAIRKSYGKASEGKSKGRQGRQGLSIATQRT